MKPAARFPQRRNRAHLCSSIVNQFAHGGVGPGPCAQLRKACGGRSDEAWVLPHPPAWQARTTRKVGGGGRHHDARWGLVTSLAFSNLQALPSCLYQRLMPSLGSIKQRSGSAQMLKRQPSAEMAEPPDWPAGSDQLLRQSAMHASLGASPLRAHHGRMARLGHAQHDRLLRLGAPIKSGRRTRPADAIPVPALHRVSAAQAKRLIQVPNGARGHRLVAVLVQVCGAPARQQTYRATLMHASNPDLLLGAACKRLLGQLW